MSATYTQSLAHVGRNYYCAECVILFVRRNALRLLRPARTNTHHYCTTKFGLNEL